MPGEADPFEVARAVLIPEIKYFNILTHAASGDVPGASSGDTACQVVLSCNHSKGKLLVLTISITDRILMVRKSSRHYRCYESNLPVVSPGRDGHRQFQPDVIRRRANEKLVIPGFNDILLFLRVPVAQAFGGHFNRDFA